MDATVIKVNQVLASKTILHSNMSIHKIKYRVQHQNCNKHITKAEESKLDVVCPVSWEEKYYYLIYYLKYKSNNRIDPSDFDS